MKNKAITLCSVINYKATNNVNNNNIFISQTQMILNSDATEVS